MSFIHTYIHYTTHTERHSYVRFDLQRFILKRLEVLMFTSKRNYLDNLVQVSKKHGFRLGDLGLPYGDSMVREISKIKDSEICHIFKY